VNYFYRERIDSGADAVTRLGRTRALTTESSGLRFSLASLSLSLSLSLSRARARAQQWTVVPRYSADLDKLLRNEES